MPSGPGLVVVESLSIARVTPFTVVVIASNWCVMGLCGDVREWRGSSRVKLSWKCLLKDSAHSSEGSVIPLSSFNRGTASLCLGFSTRQIFLGSLLKVSGRVLLQYLSLAF